MNPTFFNTQSDFRRWLEKNHGSAKELWVGFYKKSSSRPSITWPQSVDEALCFGWIDGIRKSIDDVSYKIRFTPRKRGSIWSAVNTKRAQELIDQGLMRPAGLKAFEARDEKKSGIYSYESFSLRSDKFPEPYETKFKKNKKAWVFFQSQPPGYRRIACWWVISAKKEETRLKRLATLIEVSATGGRVGQIAPAKANTD